MLLPFTHVLLEDQIIHSKAENNQGCVLQNSKVRSASALPWFVLFTHLAAKLNAHF